MRSFRLGSKAVYLRLREQIATQVYAIDAEIPSSRALAKELGVSRTTVCLAYDQLAAEGYIIVRQGARPRVAVSFPSVPSPHAMPRLNGSDDIPLSRYGRAVADVGPLPRPSPKELLVNFRYGEVSSRDFPMLQWRRAMTKALTSNTRVLSYGDPRGSHALRRALQGYLWRARSINCHVDQIVIVSGSQQALDLLARILLDPDDAFVIENPSYAMARHAFEATGAKAVPVEVDAGGLDVSRIVDVRARLAYVTPSHQYPLGEVLTLERRLDLIAWSKRFNAWVIEDDYDGEYRYNIKPLPPLWAVNENDRVVYIGTVSKILSPTIRIGYVVLPDALREVFVSAKQLTDRHTGLHEQDALATLIHGGAYERHVRRQRRLNHKRREVLIDALRSNFGTSVDVEGIDAGLHLVAWFRDLPASREEEFIERARSLGTGIYSIRPLCDPPLSSSRNAQVGLVMGYASLDPVWIVQGVTILRRALAEILYSTLQNRGERVYV